MRTRMRMRMGLLGLGLLLPLEIPEDASGEQYNVVASAGNDGDSHGGDNSDPDAFAVFQREEVGGGSEFYQASADASSGSVYASASRVDPLPAAAISTSAAAGIEETIHFDELPATSVTIRATLGVGVQATRNVGAASASARLDLGSCSVTRSYNAALGAQSSSNCPGPQEGTVELVLTREQLIASGGQVDIEVHVSAQLESIGGIDGSAVASGGIPLSRGAAPVPGQVFLELDPPLAISFTGTQTDFPATPVPEPAAPLLLAIGATTLAVRRRLVH